MNDILKYWPIRFDYGGSGRMSVPMGEITGIKEIKDGQVCTIHTKGDSWTTETTTYDEVMEQWTKAIRSVQTEWEHI